MACFVVQLQHSTGRTEESEEASAIGTRTRSLLKKDKKVF
jgi:hypothetical protein